MSEAPKSVEEQVVAPVDATPAVVEPETTPVATEIVQPTSTEAPVTEAAPEVTEPVEESAKVEEPAKPVEEGILGYKGPGLLKGLIFQKKFFWFGTEPVEHKSLTSYLRGEKQQETANKNAAWAAHTGKGLLFFSKKESEKATPHGVFNLSEVSDVSDEGTVAFFFTAGGHKHTFEATTMAIRDGWVAALNTKIAEAKELSSTISETEEYKKAITELTPVVAAASLPKKSVDKVVETKETKAEEKKEDKAEEKKEVKEEKKEEKKSRKSRSASRKRNSIFGGFGLGKKEEKVESPTTEEPAPTAAAEEPVTATEPVAEEPVTVAEPAVESAATETPAVVEKPAPTKRNSIFGTLKQQFSNKAGSGEKKTEEAPVVPAKDAAEPVSELAPVIPAVEASEPLPTSVESPAAAVETETPNGETKVETPVVKSDKRKSSLPFGFGKKEKSATSDEESTDKPFFAKLRATVKGKKSEKPVEAAPEVPSAVEETPVVEPAVIAEPEPVIPATTPQVAASA